ncbi:uncharacterized protein LOC129776437 [Toxorhynchites rutilus septentrionalis]|uniref:uncharacterized protein LOC129776437 n=1 Tax=Toxorhynchites rutilus septentrionalis TaxID=329112 RepID=UPI00247A6B63|nr:uncharacterized protein LOC129776437 [Toxorhynchites rutilus septentrionalis]
MSQAKINVYFFTNGQPFKPPHKVVIERKQLEQNQIVERINRLHYYNGYVVYSLFGEVLRSIQEIHDESAFVAVPSDQCFQPGPYVKVFRDYINAKLPPAYESKKSKKPKKPITKPLGTSYGCKAPLLRIKKDVRFCPGCRHIAVDTRCQEFAGKQPRGKQDVCVCKNVDLHGECVPMPVRPKRKIKRKPKQNGLSSCFRKKNKKQEYVVRMRKRDLVRMEQMKARKEQRPRSRQGSACCGSKPSRKKYLKKAREKMIKQRAQRIKMEENRRIKEQRSIQNRIKRRRMRRKCASWFSPCCVRKPEPIWRQPTPHNCVEHLKQARDHAIRRRRALQIPEQTSWESVTFPPKFKKKIRGTQTTKADLKKARKASASGWSCFGSKKKKKKVVADAEAVEQPVC